MQPQYPIYIVSKGRWNSRKTVKALDKMKVEYIILVEPQEWNFYDKFIPPSKLMVLPFANLNQGSIPARNFAWEHSISSGFNRHWVLDDNIHTFLRYNNNKKYEVLSGKIFRAAEDFVDRYENIALAGFNYRFLGGNTNSKLPPFRLNTRIYSCILIKNDLPYRWRGKYNEDTDLSLRALKDGWCTVLFQAFLIDKMSTRRSKERLGGGNVELYEGNGRLEMAQSLCEQHPDVSKVSWKWGRWQHHVDYSPFKNNKLILKEGVVIPQGINNYGMVLKEIKTGGA